MSRQEQRFRYPWQEQYFSELGLVPPGKELNKLEGILCLPDCGGLLPESGVVLQEWKKANTPIGLNIVVVSPNEGDLPLRVLSYLATACQTIQALSNFGLTVTTLRIINPCYLNVLCNGGNVNYQIQYGEQLKNQFVLWMKKHFPYLLTTGVEVVLDQGVNVLDQGIDSNGILQYARNFAAEIAYRNLELWETLLQRSENNSYQQGSPQEEAMILDNEDRTAVYVSAHPLAWQYTQTQKNELLFKARKVKVGGVINFMPQSELLFLKAMQYGGIPISPTESGVVTTVSRMIIHPPYYPLMTELEGEKLKDSLALRWDINATDLQNLLTSMKRFSGCYEGAEILDCLGHLRALLQESNRQRR